MKKSTIGKFLLFCILVTSSLVTTAFTAFSYYSDYQKEISALDHKFFQISQITIPPLVGSVYSFSDDQIEIQLRGVVSVPDMIEAKIVSSDSEKELHSVSALESADGETEESAELIQNSIAKVLFNKLLPEFPPETRRFELYHSAEQQLLGYLDVKFSVRSIYFRLVSDALFFFFSQFLKTIIVSILIMGIFKMFLTRHLGAISRAFEDFDQNSPVAPDKLKLNRIRNKTNDELDLIEVKFNQMASEIHKNSILRMDELNVHKKLSEKSSQLASVGTMASSIVHEINNPLGIIRGFNRMIVKKSDDPDVEFATMKIEKTIVRMQEIIDSLLMASRSTEGETFKTVEAGDFFAEVASLLKIRLKEFFVEFTLSYVGDSQSREFDCLPLQMSQVLIIIVNNAIDAVKDLPDGCRAINIECDISHGMVQFKIQDSGDGVPDEFLDQVMNTYFTTKSDGGGTGLGLSIANKIIEAHEGSIEIINQNESSFVLRFPTKRSAGQSVA